MTQPPPPELPIAVRAYARHRGVNEKSVRLAIQDGPLVRSVVRSADGAPPKILASVADQEWRARTNPAQSRAPDHASIAAAGRPDDY